MTEKNQMHKYKMGDSSNSSNTYGKNLRQVSPPPVCGPTPVYIRNWAEEPARFQVWCVPMLACTYLSISEWGFSCPTYVTTIFIWGETETAGGVVVCACLFPCPKTFTPARTWKKAPHSNQNGPWGQKGWGLLS